jgi:putative Mg2+ transporter-C (MgtC) family protein
MVDAVHPETTPDKDNTMNAWWHEVWVTLQAEFADVGDASQLTRITVRLLMAAVLGAILGFEREHKGKAAGVRTHMLVALGAALFVLVPQMSGSQADAMSRVVQGVIAGIGFLGAGTILKNNEGDEGHVKGLTTAAGLGREATAVLSTLLALAILSVMPAVVRMIDKDKDQSP